MSEYRYITMSNFDRLAKINPENYKRDISFSLPLSHALFVIFPVFPFYFDVINEKLARESGFGLCHEKTWLLYCN